MNRFRKHWHCLKYLLRHKWFVFVACCSFGIPYRGITHDLSKFFPDEWFAYANYFFGDDREAAKEAFDRAWLYHQHRNPHHWQYWLQTQNDGTIQPLPMPSKYRREMIADWIGASWAQGNNAQAWYQDHRDKMILHSETREWVEDVMRAVWCELITTPEEPI